MPELPIPTDAALSAWRSLGGAPAAEPAVAQLSALASAAGLSFVGGRGQGPAGPVLRFADPTRVVELHEGALRAVLARAAAGRPVDWAAYALPEGAAPDRASPADPL
jgi:hypothetical protein